MTATLFLFGACAGVSEPNHQSSNIASPPSANRIEGNAIWVSLASLTGDLYGDYLGPDWPMHRVIQTAMGGPPDADVRLPNGLIRMSGCRLDSCDEKGALIVDGDRNVLAAAVLHFDCSEASRSDRQGYQCRRDPVLTIVQRIPIDADIQAHLVDWARQADSRVGQVEVVTAPR